MALEKERLRNGYLQKLSFRDRAEYGLGLNRGIATKNGVSRVLAPSFPAIFFVATRDFETRTGPYGLTGNRSSSFSSKTGMCRKSGGPYEPRWNLPVMKTVYGS